MRASDADRDVVIRVLGQAYSEGRLDATEFDERSSGVQAARTLGELPGFLTDLIPSGEAVALPASTGIAPLVAADVEGEAVARWEKSRREAFSMWVFVTLVCWVIWSVTDLGGFPWPVFPTLGTSFPLFMTILQRKDMIASNRRKIVAKHEKAVAKASQQLPIEQQREDEPGGPTS